MLNIEYGTVIYFDGRLGRERGFLAVVDNDGQETGETLFFYSNDGQHVVASEFDDQVDFVGRVSPRDGLHLRHPKKGDKIAFRVDADSRNTDVRLWVYAEEYDACVNELANRRYRITRVTESLDVDDVESSKVTWEGQSAAALSDAFPVRVADGRVIDPLGSVINADAGTVTHHRIERWHDTDVCGHNGNGRGAHVSARWSPCMDPRDLSDDVLQLIEA